MLIFIVMSSRQNHYLVIIFRNIKYFPFENLCTYRYLVAPEDSMFPPIYRMIWAESIQYFRVESKDLNFADKDKKFFLLIFLGEIQVGGIATLPMSKLSLFDFSSQLSI